MQIGDATLIQGDAISEIKNIETESVNYSFFSPPFAALYVFSDDVRDLSNVKDNKEFFDHFEYLIPELFRVLKPGRNLSMHLTQLTTGIARDGYLSIVDFRGDVIRLFQKHGWIFHAEVTVWKDPELAAIRTKNVQLLHKQTKRDSCLSRPGLADYVVTFRKPGVNNSPVNYDKNGIPFELWTKIASPIWLEINESDTLQFRSARESNDERHITPTQLKCIEWSYLLWSNPNDLIFCPFAGIGSELYQALKMNRRAIGIELKASYFETAVKNCKNVEMAKAQIQMF